jgi:3-oxoacyl-[acyl-carrier protein] reductase
MLLEGKTALITGAGRGIGRGIAEAFAKRGCDVAAVARTLQQVEETADYVRDLGRRALAISCDVSAADDVARCVDTILTQFGQIDLLVNNAGVAIFKPIAETTLKDWKQTLDVNLTGAFLMIKAVMPSMMERNQGRIINISSVAGLKPLVDQGAYCASKHGLNGFSKVLAMELRDYNIAVHTICPGGVDTELARDAMPRRDKSNWMQPEDIANACLYLASLHPRATVDELSIRRFGSMPIGG